MIGVQIARAINILSIPENEVEEVQYSLNSQPADEHKLQVRPSFTAKLEIYKNTSSRG